MLIPFLIPAVILAICIITFLLLRRTFSDYFKGLEDRTNLLQRVLYLVMTKDIVSFFASPEANRIVEILFDDEARDKVDMEDELLKSVQSAGPEIEKLYTSLSKAYEPSSFIDSARSASVLLRINILLYGVAVSASEFMVVYFAYLDDYSRVTFLNGIVFGGTILFALALVTMVVYIYSKSRRIHRHMRKLSDPSLLDSPMEG